MSALPFTLGPVTLAQSLVSVCSWHVLIFVPALSFRSSSRAPQLLWSMPLIFRFAEFFLEACSAVGYQTVLCCSVWAGKEYFLRLRFCFQQQARALLERVLCFVDFSFSLFWIMKFYSTLILSSCVCVSNSQHNHDSLSFAYWFW